MMAGYETPAEFVRAHGLNSTTYYHHENGHRDISRDAAELYAKLLRIPAGALLYGELHPGHRVAIVGRIGAGGKAEAVAENNHVAWPNSERFVAHEVCDTDLYPAYRPGDVIFHLPLRNYIARELHLLHGQECLVDVESGRYLRQISVQPDGRVTLIAYQAPPILNQRLHAAAPVEMVRRYVPPALKALYSSL